jgi:hypothetical protein
VVGEVGPTGAAEFGEALSGEDRRGRLDGCVSGVGGECVDICTFAAQMAWLVHTQANGSCPLADIRARIRARKLAQDAAVAAVFVDWLIPILAVPNPPFPQYHDFYPLFLCVWGNRGFVRVSEIVGSIVRGTKLLSNTRKKELISHRKGRLRSDTNYLVVVVVVALVHQWDVMSGEI